MKEEEKKKKEKTRVGTGGESKARAAEKDDAAFLFCFRLHNRRETSRGRKELLVPGKQEPNPHRRPHGRGGRLQRGPGRDWIG